MRVFIFGFYLIYLFGCVSKTAKVNNKGQPNNKIKVQGICNQDYDSILLKYSEDFNSSNIELERSISKKLDCFLLEVDTSCLRKQKNFALFIAEILLKLYYSHLKCCNQSYDLLSMKEGAAGIIINEFEKLAGYQNPNLEMLSSSTIVGYVEKKSELGDNAFLKEILIKIRNEEHRISNGNI